MELLKQIGAFMVCAQTILHFKPHQKYDKYLKLLAGIMVIAQLLVPLLSVLTDSEVSLYKEDRSFFGEVKGLLENTDVNPEVNQMWENADEILNKYMDIEVKSRLNNENIEDSEADE